MPDCSINRLYVSDPAVISSCSKTAGVKSGIIFFVIVGALYYMLEYGMLNTRKKTDPNAKLNNKDIARIVILVIAILGISFFVLPQVMMKRAIKSWRTDRKSLELLKIQGLNSTDAIRQVQSHSESKRQAGSLLASAIALGMLV